MHAPPARWYCCRPSGFSVTAQAFFHSCPCLLTDSGFNTGLPLSGRPAPPLDGGKSSQVFLYPPLPLASLFCDLIFETLGRLAGGRGGTCWTGHRTGASGSLRSITESRPYQPTAMPEAAAGQASTENSLNSQASQVPECEPQSQSRPPPMQLPPSSLTQG